MKFKAVIFDLGGVCVGSPMAGIHRFEKENGLPRNYINVAIVKQGEQGAFQKLERGEIKLHEFYEDFGKQLSHSSNKDHYRSYLSLSGKDIPETIPDVKINGKALFTMMMAETANIDPYIFHAIEKLKASGQFVLAALTNNFDLPDDDIKEAEEMGSAAAEKLRSLFDFFFESRVMGLRKPDPEIYKLACKSIGIQPHEAIFLDDIGMNLRAASKLGIATIQVKMGHSIEAVKQLEKLTGLELLNKDYAKL
ncbi:HAD-like domain-containing protein [Blakeslea trispora]|nr:HAD-like domain-containing protein [Blakeslea trispora]